MKRCASSLWLALALLVAGLGLASPCGAVPPAGDAERGRQLYEGGGDSSGQRLRATRLGIGPVGDEVVACVNCHRPSTRGGIEGGLLVPPIGGDVLFSPGRPPTTRLNMQWMRHQTRSAYDSLSLARALREGRDPDGKALGPEMPRYALSDRDARDLEAYLRARGTETVPGLIQGRLHVATVFTPDAPEARRDTVMRAMRAWSVGQRFGSVPVVWQPWVLHGPKEGWGEQLDRLFRQQAVFGLISGAGGAHWEAVQDFCERRRIACVFPSVDRIPDFTDPPQFSAYFSGGVDAEARMMAQALAISKRPTSQLHQIWRNEAGAAAARTLEAALPPALRPAHTLRWSGAKTPVALPADGVLMLWLDARDTSDWLRAHRPGAERAVYLSGQLAPAQSVVVPPAWRSRVRWLSMRAAPVDFQGALAVSLEPWARGLVDRPDISTVELADVRAAAFLFGDAAGLSLGVLRPDFLLERLETAVRQRVAASIYIQASLGPRQRIASKGGHVLGFRDPQDHHPAQVSPYLRSEAQRAP